MLRGFERSSWKPLVKKQTLIPDYIGMTEAITCSKELVCSYPEVHAGIWRKGTDTRAEKQVR